jgi:ubiquinol-cytochrome c reductase cytochrome c subunit
VKGRHGADGSRSGRPLAGLLTAAVLAVAGAVAIWVSGAGPAAAQVASQATGPDGPSLFLQNCATCHGPKAEGTAAGPSLVGVGAASVDFYLRTGRMPLGAPGQRPHRQPPRFDETEIQALVTYVRSLGADGPEIPQVGAAGEVHKGWELYTANCAACHAATGAGNAVGGGFVAYGLGKAADVEIAEAMLIGPGAMPRFQFSQAEQDDIVAYVKFLQGAPSPGGAPIGGFGPVAEGFVAVLVGLTALVVVAMFVGRQSHSGEPHDPVAVDRPVPGTDV